MLLFTEEILNGKLHFLCNDLCNSATQPIIPPNSTEQTAAKCLRSKLLKNLLINSFL